MYIKLKFASIYSDGHFGLLVQKELQKPIANLTISHETKKKNGY